MIDTVPIWQMISVCRVREIVAIIVGSINRATAGHTRDLGVGVESKRRRRQSKYRLFFTRLLHYIKSINANDIDSRVCPDLTPLRRMKHLADLRVFVYVCIYICTLYIYALTQKRQFFVLRKKNRLWYSNRSLFDVYTPRWLCVTFQTFVTKYPTPMVL